MAGHLPLLGFQAALIMQARAETKLSKEKRADNRDTGIVISNIRKSIVPFACYEKKYIQFSYIHFYIQISFDITNG